MVNFIDELLVFLKFFHGAVYEVGQYNYSKLCYVEKNTNNI